jgi:hypothetical protein
MSEILIDDLATAIRLRCALGRLGLQPSWRVKACMGAVSTIRDVASDVSDIASLLQHTVGGEEKRRCAAGSAATSCGVDPYPGRRRRARRARAFEGFDDDHPAAATRATARSRRSFGVMVLGLTVRLSGRAFGCGQQMTSALDVVGSNDTGEQAAMADAMEDARQL